MMTTRRYTAEDTTIGFVGLGIMGEPMARNLLSAGYRLQVHNRSREPAERLAEAGASAVASPADAARGADVVITMLPDSPEVDEVVNGAAGVAGTIADGATLIDMSTISPLTTRELAATLERQGVRMLDAPVSGGQQGAINGALTIMVGGDPSTFSACEPIFEQLGSSVTLIGETGAGQVAKACNQIIVAGTIQTVSEALTLAARSGVDPATVRSALLGGFAGSKILEVHGQRMIDRTFAPGFKVRLHDKDLKIALETGASAGVTLLTTAVVKQLLGALTTQGHGDADHSALALLAEQLSSDGSEQAL